MPSNPVRFTENDVRRALRSALKEDLAVTGYEITKSGTIRVLTSPPDNATVESSPGPGVTV